MKKLSIGVKLNCRVCFGAGGDERDATPAVGGRLLLPPGLPRFGQATSQVRRDIASHFLYSSVGGDIK